ncbi:SAM-dependent methyltransferase [Ideonella sp. DXS29W]|uniref:SAM-dependent methyltransferase n=1 Tax=Ideonella lacteola TaxID=2984193 RepID=A0ABU9BMD6_9BURK
MNASLASDPPADKRLGDPADALADLARRERFFDALAASLESGGFRLLVLGKPRSAAGDLVRVSARPIELRGVKCLQLLHHHRTRDLTENLPLPEAQARLDGLVGPAMSHAHLFTAEEELQLLISKKGRMALRRARIAKADEGDAADGNDPAGTAVDREAGRGHQRTKRRMLSLQAPFLQALGVVDRSGALVPAMARKWKQINKFVEVLDHALDEAGLAQGTPPADAAPLQVVDFGAGKGYLTFATHHHLSDPEQGRGWPTQTCGVELRQELVDLCNDAARRCAMPGLAFECGDVSRVLPPHVDVMIALHACDTATDHALHAGICAGAAVILSSPCCHKQIRPQLQLPAVLRPMLRHGIHLGQEAEMVTDSLRALLLESRGYDAQVFEFVSLEHTSKNKMILAVKRRQPLPAARQAALLAQIAEIKSFYGIQEHCLESLLQAEAA